MWNDYYDLIKELANQIKGLTSINDLLEGKPKIQPYDAFKKWSVAPLWQTLIDPLIAFQKDWLWFDLVLWNPLIQSYDFRAVYSPFFSQKYPEDLSTFLLFQNFARTDYYRKKCFSLSTMLTEGNILPISRGPIWVSHCYEERPEILTGVRRPFIHINIMKWNVNLPQSMRGQNELTVDLEKQIQELLDYNATTIIQKHWFKHILIGLKNYFKFNIMELEEKKKIDFPKTFARYLSWLVSLPKWRHYIYIPLPNLSKYTGSLVLAYGDQENQTWEWKKEPKQRSIESQIDHIKNRLRRAMDRFAALAAVVSSKAEEAAPEFALKAATGAIMARNMSHNIGSHVLPRTTLEKILERIEDFPWKPTDDTNRLSLLKSVKTKLDEYIQLKADFLAEITTEPLLSTRPAFFYREVILPLVTNTLFMDNIAANEGIHYYKDGVINRLRIAVKIHGKELKAEFKCTRQGCSKTFSYPNKLPYGGCCPKHSVPLEVSIHNGDADVEVELPGPLGQYALYGFIENFIRNVAKHNIGKLSKEPYSDLTINICLEDKIDDTGNKVPDYFAVTIWEKSTPIDKLELLKDHLSTAILEPTGKLHREAWGLAEMKICATLLRGSKKFGQMENEKFLRIETGDHSGEKWLEYHFDLMKAKKVVAVLPGWQDEAEWKNLRNQGVWIFKSLADIQKEFDGSASLASFRFALIDCSDPEHISITKELRDYLPILPFRILVLKGNDNLTFDGVNQNAIRVVDKESSDFNDKIDANKLFPWLWEKWLGRWGSEQAHNGRFLLDVYLDQYKRENPTQEWEKRSEDFNKSSQLIALRVWAVNNVRGYNPSIDDCLGHIVYDRHGRLGGRLADGKYWESIKSNRAYTMLNKMSPDFANLFCPAFPPEGLSWLLPYELVEAGLLKILIIDERVAELTSRSIKETDTDTMGYDRTLKHLFCANNQDINIVNWHMCKAANIFVCTHFGIDTQMDHVEPIHESLKDKIDIPSLKLTLNDGELKVYFNSNTLDYNPLSFDILIIHQGVLDRWERDKGKDQEIVLNYLKSNIPFVAVESGRGISPALLKTKEKFLPFSLLQHYILGKSLSKYGLSCIVMSLYRWLNRGGNNG